MLLNHLKKNIFRVVKNPIVPKINRIILCFLEKNPLNFIIPSSPMAIPIVSIINNSCGIDMYFSSIFSFLVTELI